jgi:uncharacterized membrane protein YcfT
MKKGKFWCFSLLFLVLEVILVWIAITITGGSMGILLDLPTLLEVIAIPCIFIILGLTLQRDADNDSLMKHLYKMNILSGVVIWAVNSIMLTQAAYLELVEGVFKYSAISTMALLYGFILGIAFLGGRMIAEK